MNILNFTFQIEKKCHEPFKGFRKVFRCITTLHESLTSLNEAFRESQRSAVSLNMPSGRP